MPMAFLIPWPCVIGIDELEKIISLPVGEQVVVSPTPNFESPNIGVGFDLTASYGF